MVIEVDEKNKQTGEMALFLKCCMMNIFFAWSLRNFAPAQSASILAVSAFAWAGNTLQPFCDIL